MMFVTFSMSFIGRILIIIIIIIIIIINNNNNNNNNIIIIIIIIIKTLVRVRNILSSMFIFSNTYKKHFF